MYNINFLNIIRIYTYEKWRKSMNREYYEEHGGTLSDVDIQKERKRGQIFIEPFDILQLQPSGYNLTPTKFFYSTKKKRFLEIVENDEEVYVMIDKNDTVLVLTRESVAISESLTGAFYSKVKIVSDGFGHVSTTLDPEWDGKLLISLNNPTNKKIKFSIEKNVYGKTVYNSFVTLEISYLTSRSSNHSDNPPARLDILNNAVERNISMLKKNKIVILRQLIEELKKQEKSIQDLILDELDENEKVKWKQISTITDDNEYLQEKEKFLYDKKVKYLRRIQTQYYENAEKQIEIINKLIRTKQQYLPIRRKIWKFIYEKRHNIIAAVIFIVLCIIHSVLNNYGKADTKANDIVIGAAIMIVGYLISPIFNYIFQKVGD